ncbi:hypothetical protein HZR84_09815 [Hyphobacterium sp. CCMP332]|nr:hypothetical protein HZR84_09815 [Hyphobacterium sp. CCMP332]
MEIGSILIVSFYLAHLVSRAKVEIVLDKRGFSHIWIRRFFFSKKKDLHLKWGSISTFDFHEDRTFDAFILQLENNGCYEIDRLNLIPIKDDFKSLVHEFQTISNNFKNTDQLTIHDNWIEKAPNPYKTKSFKYAFYFLSLGFILLTLIKIFNPNESIAWSSLGVIFFGLLFYGSMIYEEN